MATYFFVGIGGIGMSALAELLKAKGHVVKGSDVADSETVQRLTRAGISVSLGHSVSDFLGCDPDFLVINSAISSENPIFLAAKARGCRVYSRGELLAECVNATQGLVVSGSHGKTTTSSMLTHVLRATGRDISFAIGGRFADTHENSGLGEEPFFVAEGDESDASFLKLRPRVLAITNLDADHMSTYGHRFDELIQSFVDWVRSLPEGGAAVVNVDDVGVRQVLAQLEREVPAFWEKRRLISVGTSVHAKIRLCETTAVEQQRKVNFSVDSTFYDAIWPFMGEYNAMNALMAGAMASAIGVDWLTIILGMESYPGVSRRMDYLGTYRDVLVFEDYGHHPTEIRASLMGLKQAYPEKRLIQVFQPHRYTRTRDLWNEFVEVLTLADHLILLPIYPASEAPISGIHAERLLASIQSVVAGGGGQGGGALNEAHHPPSPFDEGGASVGRFYLLAGGGGNKPLVSASRIFAADLNAALQQIESTIQPGDLLILQGAGDIPEKLGKRLFTPERSR
jgi:UDP-N-acetylmuramate--alanine ligase